MTVQTRDHGDGEGVSAQIQSNHNQSDNLLLFLFFWKIITQFKSGKNGVSGLKGSSKMQGLKEH